jgi:PTH1 family peptidyl-tRNA hydrolase
MLLIIGLGNIGEKYEHTRHNIGFDLVDQIQKNWNISPWSEKKSLKAFIAEGTKNGQKIILAKPTTFMNLSGEAAQAIKQYYKIENESCMIAYDDLDLPIGTLRIRKNGGPGTHNGMKSLVQMLGSEDFPRLRLGIESRQEKYEAADFVLGRWNKTEKEQKESMLNKAEKALETWIEKGIEAAMNNFNE